MAKLNLCFVTFAISVVGVEIFLRATCLDPLEKEIQTQSIRVPDAYLHHTLLPSTNAIVWWGRRKARYWTNDLGFRDRSNRQVPKLTSADLRILVLGDSFTEAVGVAYEDCFVDRLEAILTESGMSVETLNAGVCSYCPRLHLRKLRQFLDNGYKADVVMLMFDITDVRDESSNYENWSGFSDEEMAANHRERGLRIEAIRKEQETFAKYEMIHPRLLLLLRQLRKNTGVGPWDWLQTYAGGAFAWTEDGVFESEWVSIGIARCKERLLDIKRLCDEQEMKLVVLIYPQPPQLTSQRASSRQEEIFTVFAEDVGLDLVSLYPEFRQLRNWKPYYIYGDNHWSEKGHDLVAQAIARHLAKSVTALK